MEALGYKFRYIHGRLDLPSGSVYFFAEVRVLAQPPLQLTSVRVRAERKSRMA